MPENIDKNLILPHLRQQPPAVQVTLFPVKSIEADGIEMGVLNDGTPYLTMRGLAKVCGVDNTAILRLAGDWEEQKTKPRGRRIAEILASQGYRGDSLFVRSKLKGTEILAFPDSVCMAVLEYYAFDAAKNESEIALQNYRMLARSSFRLYIYNRCGYDPIAAIPESWKNFHERILLNDQIPIGYFSVFREIADLVVHLIQGGCPIDDHTIPDISVGMIWSKHWEESCFEEVYGARLKFDHNYPDSFPQSKSNPVPAWIYPADALGSFRIWVYENYIPDKFPNYLGRKVKQGLFPASRVQLIVDAMSKEPSVRIEEPGF